MTIEQLAAASGMTVRNIREHQTRGLLPPPVVQGRKGFYDRRHLARLAVIQRLQGEGLNLQAVAWLLDRAPSDAGEEFDRFERALLGPWGDEAPLVCDRAELDTRYGLASDAALERAQGLDLLRPLGGGRYEVVSPRLLDAGRELMALGISGDAAAEAVKRLRVQAAGIAETFVDLFVDQVWAPFEGAGRPAERWREMRETLERLRPIAVEAVLAVFGQAMAAETEQRLSALTEEPGA